MIDVSLTTSVRMDDLSLSSFFINIIQPTGSAGDISIRPCIDLFSICLLLPLDLGVIEADTPIEGAGAAVDDPFAINARQYVGVTRQQSLGGAHFRAQRQLALGEAIATVLLVFL